MSYLNKKIILKFENLVLKFKTRSKILTVLRNVSLDVFEGETLAIVGESGSGKTVLTKTVTNIIGKNGWIANGDVTYFPINDDNSLDDGFFKEPINTTNYHRVLLDNDLRKSVINFYKKQIQNIKKQIQMINFDSSLYEKESPLNKNKLLKTIEKLNAKCDKLILQNNRLKQELKNTFSTKISLASSRIDDKIAKTQELKSLFTNQNIRDEKITEYENQIKDFWFEISRIKNLSIIEKKFLNKIINILIRYVENSLDKNLLNKTLNLINLRFEKMKAKTPFTQKVEQLFKFLLEDKELPKGDFDYIIQEWSFLKKSNFVNRIRVNKNFTTIRGKTIASIFQDPMTSLNPLLSVGFQVSEVLRKHRGLSRFNAKKTAIELLKRVGIPNAEKRYRDIPGFYSGGMRQRVVIAIALACNPKILICDEPTTALDVTIQKQILNLIKELQQEYKFTVIFITHDLGVVSKIADRVAIMYAGQIVEIGTTREIFFDSKHPYTWSLLLSLPQLGTKGKELFSIPGSPPSLNSEIVGDAFAPRNKYAMEIDYIYEPPTFKISETHYAKTWLLDHRVSGVSKPEELNKIKDLKSDLKIEMER